MFLECGAVTLSKDLAFGKKLTRVVAPRRRYTKQQRLKVGGNRIFCEPDGGHRLKLTQV